MTIIVTVSIPIMLVIIILNKTITSAQAST